MFVFIKVSVLSTLKNFHVSGRHGKGLFAVLLLASRFFSIVVTLAGQSRC